MFDGVDFKSIGQKIVDNMTGVVNFGQKLTTPDGRKEIGDASSSHVNLRKMEKGLIEKTNRDFVSRVSEDFPRFKASRLS